jgi:outer membrane lipoprotein-sorting protein
MQKEVLCLFRRIKMRILITRIALVICLSFSLSEAGQIEAPSMPLMLSDDVSWLNTTIKMHTNGKRDYQRNHFIAIGKKWRLETDMFNNPTVVIIFDGKSMVSNLDSQKSKILEEEPPQFWDQRTYIKNAYKSFIISHYMGVEKIDRYTCWHFFDEGEDIKLDLWVDVKKMVPRRMFINFEDGSAIRFLYDDLPEPVKVTPDLFNTEILNVMLLNN